MILISEFRENQRILCQFILAIHTANFCVVLHRRASNLSHEASFGDAWLKNVVQFLGI